MKKISSSKNWFVLVFETYSGNGNDNHDNNDNHPRDGTIQKVLYMPKFQTTLPPLFLRKNRPFSRLNNGFPVLLWSSKSGILSEWLPHGYVQLVAP